MVKNQKKRSAAGTIFTLIGAVMGAGFISGRELIVFFGCFNLSAILLSCSLFLVCFSVCLRLGEKYGGYSQVINEFFPFLAGKIVKTAVLLAGFTTSAIMLSAVNAMFPLVAPLPSFLLLLIAVFLFRRGTIGLKIVNLFLTPLIVGAVIILSFFNKAYSPPESGGFYALFLAVIYTFNNCFLTFPLLCDIGAENVSKGASKGTSLKIGIFSAGIIAFLMGTILSAVCSDKNSFLQELPMQYILKLGKGIFSLLAFGGMATTLFSSFYPLAMIARNRANKTGIFFLAVCVWCCSYISFGKLSSAAGILWGGTGAVMAAYMFIQWIVKKTGEKRREQNVFPKAFEFEKNIKRKSPSKKYSE